MRTRVKICGITRPDDALRAADLGVDAIGLVFCQNSPRHVTLKQAEVISRVLPAFVNSVALFLDAPDSAVEEVINELPVDLLQFHGAESEEYCDRFAHPYIKAIGMGTGMDNMLTQEALKSYANARALLLDSHTSGVAGGTGETFDWGLIPDKTQRALILAGGLSVDNVAEAIRRVSPWGVDVSSGVESAKGIKDAGLMAQFVKEVKYVDCEVHSTNN